MTTTKSQLEKFHNRQAKMKVDEVAVQEDLLKNSTVKKQGQKVAEKHGISTEDIFAIITRESMGSFVKLWNNSMETVVRETLRTEVKTIMREIIQEEMVEAYRGIVKGMTSVEDIVKQEMEEIIREEIIPTVTKPSPTKEKRSYAKSKSPNAHSAELEQSIIEAFENGNKVLEGATFKKVKPRYSTLYQRFMKENKGVKGAWYNHVNNILDTHMSNKL